MNIQPRRVWLLALLAGLPTAAGAGVCYHVVDRNDAIVYRSAVPPFPLAGAEFTTGQRRLANAGQHLFWFDATSCPEEDEARAPGPKPISAEASDIVQAPHSVARSSGAAGASGAVTPRSAPTSARTAPASARSAPMPAKSAAPAGGGRKY